MKTKQRKTWGFPRILMELFVVLFCASFFFMIKEGKHILGVKPSPQTNANAASSCICVKKH